MSHVLADYSSHQPSQPCFVVFIHLLDKNNLQSLEFYDARYKHWNNERRLLMSGRWLGLPVEGDLFSEA
jgi:hypothetical protein